MAGGLLYKMYAYRRIAFARNAAVNRLLLPEVRRSPCRVRHMALYAPHRDVICGGLLHEHQLGDHSRYGVPLWQSVVNTQYRTKLEESTKKRRKMEQDDRLRHFTEAMIGVYGFFDDLTEDEAASWDPPHSPGAGGHGGRYLWTDAFAVVNFITLFRETSSPKYLTLAKRLVTTVHDVLGRTRDGSARLPGATDAEPLRGGLRIGKPSATGADGDGQYHHYLTLWMFALNRISLAAEAPVYNALAVQLAQAIHPHFVLRRASGEKHMVWKISTDMQHVLVSSQGHLDAATGYVVCKLLQRGAAAPERDVLAAEVADYEHLMHQGSLSPSGDSLDLGMGLWISQFAADERWAADLREEGLQLARVKLGEDSELMRKGAAHRLAFREFGACLGVSCTSEDEHLRARVDAVVEFWEKQVQRAEDVGPAAHFRGHVFGRLDPRR